MSTVSIIFPHQLFLGHPVVGFGHRIYLVEEDLFFVQVPFHKSKLAFHRATMRYYRDFLMKGGAEVRYVQSGEQGSDIRELIPLLADEGVREIVVSDPTDDWLEKRLKKAAAENDIGLRVLESDMFINTRSEMESYLGESRPPLQTSFYIAQRKKHGILIHSDGKPVGGKWTYDQLNRQRYPDRETPPRITWPAVSKYLLEAGQYVERRFNENPGSIHMERFYPHTHADAERWLDTFLIERFDRFGPYQDALLPGHSYLHHSVLSPMLNTGLLTPIKVIERALEYSRNEKVPLNSLEGFIRQILGWREYVRGIYHLHGARQRTMNFWGHHGRIPKGFWNGQTGIPPVDEVIQKLLHTGYAHHIERLMVVGNFMLLCGFDPDEVYRWFMSLFIDSYDWVMVPNVYGMSQYSDGGLLATKPYISGSNYLMKMGRYPKGEWQEIWDGLFWNFISSQREFFMKNPRLSLMVRSLDRMDPARKKQIFKSAYSFLESQDSA